MPDFDDRVSGDSPNRAFHNTEPEGQRTSMARIPTPKFTVWMLHYGQGMDYSFVALFATEALAKERVGDDLLEYAKSGFKEWSPDNGPRPEYPDIEEVEVIGSPPKMYPPGVRGDDMRPRSYEKRRPGAFAPPAPPLTGAERAARRSGPPPVVARDPAGREVIQYEGASDGTIAYVWRATGATLTQDECDELGLSVTDL